LAPAGFGENHVPEASITVSASTVAKTPRLSNVISKGAFSRPADFTLSKPLRVMDVTRASVLIALAKSVRVASGAK
jgi:hypothetical protein